MKRSRLPRLVMPACVILLMTFAGCWNSASDSPAIDAGTSELNAGKTTEATVSGPVTFQINDGDKVVTFDIENVSDGATLESVMRRIDRIPVSIRGSGVTAFVDQIGDLGTNSSEGWTYLVDGEFATRGIGETTLSPPTTVEWTFGSMPQQ